MSEERQSKTELEHQSKRLKVTEAEVKEQGAQMATLKEQVLDLRVHHTGRNARDGQRDFFDLGPSLESTLTPSITCCVALTNFDHPQRALTQQKLSYEESPQLQSLICDARCPAAIHLAEALAHANVTD